MLVETLVYLLKNLAARHAQSLNGNLRMFLLSLRQWTPQEFAMQVSSNIALLGMFPTLICTIAAVLHRALRPNKLNLQCANR